jgi:hypothetical protein
VGDLGHAGIVAGADNRRNPFNDSLIASGSDDGKVRLVLRMDIKGSDRLRYSSGECQMALPCISTYRRTKLRMSVRSAS